MEGEKEMVIFHKVDEQDVIDDLNKNRFEGDVKAYVVMDGAQYIGHALYRVSGEVADVLECQVTENAFVDGAVRACAAAAENVGTKRFTLNENDAALAKWRSVFCKNDGIEIENEKIFNKCAGK